jgi:hypothetical protein
MKEAETTVHMIWEIESNVNANICFKFYYLYILCSLALCAQSGQPRPTYLEYICVFSNKY